MRPWCLFYGAQVSTLRTQGRLPHCHSLWRLSSEQVIVTHHSSKYDDRHSRRHSTLE